MFDLFIFFIINSALNSIFRICRISSLRPTYTNLTEIFQEVTQEAGKALPSYVKSIALGKLVKFNLIRPSWWKDVELCFEFKSDMPGKFCSGTSPSCVKINQFTAQFKDWTRSSGGCSLSWNLRAPDDAEDWFKHVKICYKYDSHGSENCGNGAAKNMEWCSSFDFNWNPTSTISYYNRNNSPKTGCLISWKLSVPEHLAPSWFLNTKLCFSVKTGRKFLSYSKSKPELACAYVNLFTPFYDDRTFFKTRVNYRETFLNWAIIDDDL